MYKSLRTNLPRHVMAYTDLPFTFDATKSADKQLYCSHEEVSHLGVKKSTLTVNETCCPTSNSHQHLKQSNTLKPSDACHVSQDTACFKIAQPWLPLQVLRYLEMFDNAFQISQSTRFNTAVKEVSPIVRENNAAEASQSGTSTWPQWKLQSRDLVSLRSNLGSEWLKGGVKGG